jgi:hypothetical protein
MGLDTKDLLIDWWSVVMWLWLELTIHHPCGGGFEYLHRDPASRRRRRKGKSQIWESKIWSRVTRTSDPRKTTLSTASSIYKRHIRPLVREGVPEKLDRNCQRVINIWSWTPDGARHQDWLIGWSSVAMWLRLFNKKEKDGDTDTDKSDEV